MHRFLQRLFLLLGGMAAALVLLEGTLQIAALFVKDTAFVRNEAVGAPVRILCLGDSNVYGIGVEREEAYPAQLEALWNGLDDRPKAKVFNLGYPGTNSSQVLRDFRRNVELFRPDLVLVTVGANDFWTVAVQTDDQQRQTWLEWFRTHSRLLRLVYMATRGSAERITIRPDRGDTPAARRGAVIEYEGQRLRVGHEPLDGGNREGHLDLYRNLTSLFRQADELDVVIVVVNYASRKDFYAIGSDVLTKAAKDGTVPLVDVSSVFQRTVCPSEPCPEWIFPAGHLSKFHPTPKGYRLVAQAVDEVLRPLLDERGRVARRSPCAGGTEAQCTDK